MTGEVRTQQFPEPEKHGLIEEMRYRPGSLLLYAAEWAGIVLIAIGLLSLVFALCVGGYSLVQRTP
jgi:hypothetical protein